MINNDEDMVSVTNLVKLGTIFQDLDSTQVLDSKQTFLQAETP